MSKQGPNVATFLKDFIKFTGEVTTLHGRHEVSKEGYRQLRELMNQAMQALRSNNQAPGMDAVISPKYAAKELPTNAKPIQTYANSQVQANYNPKLVVTPNMMLRGYLGSDMIVARAGMTANPRSHYKFEDGVLYYNNAPMGFPTNDREWTLEEAMMRRHGLRRPDEPDYEPLD
jgi:hypothetical protein